MLSIDISVIVLTYNQGKYIGYAIESVLKQNFSGIYNLIIYDDCSTDNTLKIASSYKEKFPNQVFLIKNPENIGLAKNFEQAVIHSEGKYIAYLEGDDYWTDPYKLQKQFNFLEEKPDFILSFHDFITVDNNGRILSEKNLQNEELKKDRTQVEMVTGCLIHQNTMMFRNVIEKFPKGFFIAKNHDTFFIAYLSNWGKAGYVNCKPLHYRIHKDSLWSSLSVRNKHLNGLITYFIILCYVSPKYYGDVILKLGSKIKALIKF